MEPTPKALFAMNMEMGTLYPIEKMIWENQDLYDLIEEFLNKYSLTLAHIPAE